MKWFFAFALILLLFLSSSVTTAVVGGVNSNASISTSTTCCTSQLNRAVAFSGAQSQGGFIMGEAQGAIKVKFNGEDIKIDKDGVFLIGIPRLHKKIAKITLIYPATAQNPLNHSETHSLTIAQRDYKTQRITGVPSRKVDPNPQDLLQIKADKKQILEARSHFTPIKYFQGNAIIPVEGRTSGVYGSQRFFNGKLRSWHKGWDIAAPTGTPVKAPLGGIVRLALANSFFNGNLVIIDHGHNLMTIYAHLDKINVQTGQRIVKNTILGTVGATGRATGPHLHWGLYWKNMALDPLFLLDTVS